jgi:hypothetical protein
MSPEEFEQALGQFFAGQKRSQVSKRGSIQVCLYGNTLQRTIPAGYEQ